MKKILTLTALILVLSILSSSLLPLSAFAAESDIVEADLDFSDPSRYECEEIPPSELLSMLLPEGSVSEEEARYLNLCTDSFLLINKSFSNERVSLHFNGEDSISVSARPYEYVANNGQTVTWTPVTAHYLDVSAPLTAGDDGDYVTELPATRRDDTVFVSVDYTCTITLSAEILDYVLNRAYRDASAAKQANLEYEAVLAAYTEKYREYTEYIAALNQYEQDMDAYNTYLKLKAEYDEDLIEYNKYLSKLPAYEAELAVYNQYLSDLEKYNADKAEYDRLYAEHQSSLDSYVEYYKTLNEIDSAMSAMESIYEPPNHNMNSLFVALQNKELISTFERYKDILALFGVKKATVDRLSKESDQLNELLRLYSIEREKSDEAAFIFYSQNYDTISYMFNHLYDSMAEIMSPKIFVKIGAKIELDYLGNSEMAAYKKWRILNLLAQIYLVSRCLDDTQTVGGTWKFYSYDGKEATYTFHSLLAPNVMLSDTNKSSPKNLSWPTVIPPVTLPPTPQPPVEVAKPLAPTLVLEPTLPEFVAEPTKPDKEVADPGKAPSKPENLSVYDEIVALLDSGELGIREINEAGEDLTLTQTIDKLVAFDNPAIISVYGDDRTTPISQYTAEYESLLVPPSITLERAPTERYVYTFEGWSLSPDSYLPAENHIVEKDISIYAYFSRTDRLYTVKWITAKGEIVEQYKYGDTPSFSGDLDKDPTNYIAYSFSGWSPAIKRVTENTTYTATYSSADRKYTITWNYLGKTVTELCTFGQMPTVPNAPEKYIEGTTLFKFVGWDSSPSVTLCDKTYTALYQEVTLAETEDESGVTLKESSSAFEITTAGNTVTAAKLLNLASSGGKRVNVKFGDTTLSIDKDATVALSRSGAYRISLIMNPSARSASEVTSLSLLITDADGNQIRLAQGEIRITIPTSRNDVTNYILYSVLDNGAKERLSYSFSDGEISFIAKPNRSFKFVQLYSVTIQTVENGETMLNKLVYEAGETVTPIYYPAISFEVTEASIVRADTKEVIKLEDMSSFSMPDSDITLVVSYNRLSYTIKFVVNGEEVLSQKYTMGSIPTPPEVVEEYTDGDYRYVFAGWSPALQSATKDMTYIAKYNSFLGPEETVVPDDSLKALSKQTTLPAIAIGVASVAALMLLITLCTQMRKKRKKSVKAKQTNK